MHSSKQNRSDTKLSSTPRSRVKLKGTTRRPGFDFTWHMRRLIDDMISRVEQLQHIDLSRVAICLVQARKNVSHGIYASLTPMRFKDGSFQTKRKGKNFTVQRLFDEHGAEMLYILSFYLPRFMNTDFQEKMITIFHELWHISPHFNGDIRRMPGRCYAHTGSQEKYDQEMAKLAKHYLKTKPDPRLYQFLHLDFAKLFHSQGSIYGVKIPRPKLIPTLST